MCRKLITVDFDATEKTQLERAIFLARALWICRTVGARCRLAKSKKGIHLYILGRYEFNARMVVRTILLDDPMRLEIDIKRHEAGAHDIEETLFEAKCQPEYCYSEEELTLDDLERVLFNEF